MEQPRTINLDGISYDVSQFSQGVQQAVAIYNKFNGQLQDQQLEVMKTQAAIQQVGAQITEAVKKELAEKQAAAAQSAAKSANGAAE
jgi:hypothetical protein